MNEKHNSGLEVLAKIWGKQREREAATMLLKRRPTEEEIERAMIIGKWFWDWNDVTGPCPITCMTPHWGKKLCALFEWIAMLENEGREDVPTKSEASERVPSGRGEQNREAPARSGIGGHVQMVGKGIEKEDGLARECSCSRGTEDDHTTKIKGRRNETAKKSKN